MPRKPALTDVQCRNAKPADKPYRLTDGNGLSLEVRPNGSKLWRYRYEHRDPKENKLKENMFAVGSYPEVSIVEARKARDAARELVKQGKHPSVNRQAEKARQIAANADTFEAVAREWIEQTKAKGRTPYYIKQIESGFDRDVFPYIGNLPIRVVTAAHLLEIVKRVEGRGAEVTALNIRQWCGGVFRFAVATLRADSDPAAAIKGAVSRPKVQHHKPLNRNEIAEFLRELKSFGGYRTTVIALRLLLLTFVRPVELRGAEWGEIDLDGAEWRIPAERMKMREPHIVPLAPQAVELLRELKKITGGQRWLFPNYRRPTTFMTGTTMNRALERMGYGGRFSSHGFRATASTILNEMGYKPDVIERQLAHKERNQVRASYNRAQYLPERRQMLMDWADMVDAWETGSNVIPGKFVGEADEVKWAMYRARTKKGTDVEAIEGKK